MGAEVVTVGPASSARQKKAEELAAQHGYVMVPPYDDAEIVAGQATCGLEIVEDLPEVDLVLSPVSGGGLLSGIATAVKLTKPSARIVGVEPELAGDTQESFRGGKIVEWPAEKTSRTICDGLRTQSVGVIPFAHIQKYVESIVTVSEDEVRQAMRRLLLEAHLVAEPSGAVTAAAIFFHEKELPAGDCVVAVLSGGNVEAELLKQVISG
jgi:threonine dehydratase